MSPKIWKLQNCSIHFEQPKIMGILNVTPDSFSDGGVYLKPEDALRRALQIEAEGADILDIGAESTRPGARSVSTEKEWERLASILKHLTKQITIPISVDTRHGTIAHRAIEVGVQIINDVSCASDTDLLKIIKQSGAAYVLMHSRGEALNMMERTQYRDVLSEVRDELLQALQRVLDLGIAKEKICLDPGIGFAKTPEQNYDLLKSLDCFSTLGYPLLIGLSRKRMLREILGDDLESLKMGSVAAGLFAIQHGAHILRVHDVAATKSAIKVWERLQL